MIKIFATEEDARRFSADLQRMAESGLRAIGEAFRPSVQAWGELARQYAEREAAAAQRRERSEPPKDLDHG